MNGLKSRLIDWLQWARRNGWLPGRLTWRFQTRWTPSNDVGLKGEDLACDYLQREGFQILERNFKRTWGEIDIIALDGKTVVYIEVKTRKSANARPETAVNHAKQKQLCRLAHSFASQYGLLHHPSRFDIVAINTPNHQEPVIRHFRNAFRTEDGAGVFTRYH